MQEDGVGDIGIRGGIGLHVIGDMRDNQRGVDLLFDGDSKVTLFVTELVKGGSVEKDAGSDNGLMGILIEKDTLDHLAVGGQPERTP